MADIEPHGSPRHAFAFDATWRDYLPIALSNLALTIVTLGIYRFWAKARERRFLWSRTRFIDETLEWSGTGREMFTGFLVVMLVLAPALLFFNVGFQALVLRGMAGIASALMLVIYAILLTLYGLAKFRGLRYRLSRTWWHGIRGGSDDPGFAYARSTLFKTVLGLLPLALLVPWSMASLWRERWNAMSFGNQRFVSTVTERGLMRRWIFTLLAPFALIMVAMLVLVSTVAASRIAPGAPPPLAIMVLLIVSIVAVYPLSGLFALAYYAKFYRQVIGNLELGPLGFEFTARTRDWLKLVLGDVALVIATLGVGISFLGYRHWSFFVRHLGATGEVDLGQLIQSRTRAPREAEGFADAFDIGAI